jgi:starch phosphorylase
MHPVHQFTVVSNVPESLRAIEVLAANLHWAWDRQLARLFDRLDGTRNGRSWRDSGQHPVDLVRRTSPACWQTLADDEQFIEQLARAGRRLDDVLDGSSWFARRASEGDTALESVAYFSPEFGITEAVPQYSGGLGVLAGDHLKASSDLGIPLVGVGLLYDQGYFHQFLDSDGWQRERNDRIDPDALGLHPTGAEIVVDLADVPVTVRVWRADVGRIRLFLLDTNVASNPPEAIAVTDRLYGGDEQHRLRQEIILGIGGVRALRALAIHPQVFHTNEGHAGFLGLERIREWVQQGLSFDEAIEAVRAGSLFTTHTPVPAGHDVFERALIEPYLADFAHALGIGTDELLALGRSPGEEASFNMTSLGLRGSRFHNGVSRIHGEVASRMEAYHWPQIPPEENPIGYVTNGVHVMTFLASEWVMFFDSRSRGWRDRMTDRRFWQDYVEAISDQAFWSLRQNIKIGLLDHVREALCRQYRRNHFGEPHIQRMLAHLSPNGNPPLVLGFARRFATYKRATLLFRDPVRLARILNQADRPIVLLFAGKAHPQDRPGQDLIRIIGDYAEQPEFEDKIFFIENYDLALGRKLVSGVDVWLNTPEYPMEACGTSGQKAGLNGALNVSILDGWWGETFDGTNGWGLVPQTGVDADTRDRLEAEELLDVLEHEVIPLYFARNSQGYSPGWVGRSKAAMQTILPRHSADRMLEDYIRQYYVPAIAHGRHLAADGGARARELTQWKAAVRGAWDGVRMQRLGEVPARIMVDAPLDLRVRVELNGLAAEHVRLECVLGEEDTFGRFHRRTCYPLQAVGTDGNATVFALQEPMSEAGLYSYEVRLFPFHPALAHPFETGRMLWL